MTRRFNYTGRERLTSEEFFAETISETPLAAALTLDLSRTPLAPSAGVVIEAYSGTITRRFNCGTVANLKVPPIVDLSALQTGGSIMFRVKVVNPETGLLLASGDRLRLVGDGEDPKRRSLLTVRVDSLGEEIWRVDVSTNIAPVLILNVNIPSLKIQLTEDQLIGGSILLPAVRKVLDVLLDDLDGLEWQSDWIQLVKTVDPDIDIEKDMHPDERETLINDIMAVLAEEWGFVTKINQTLQSASYE